MRRSPSPGCVRSGGGVIIGVASGKGGTGKTLIATGLAATLARRNKASVLLIDCDVEEPNAHLFLRPTICRQEDVSLPIPKVREDLCTHCGRCAAVCEFRAIAVARERVFVFPQLCHGCGSCARRCPQGAIIEEPRVLGTIRAGSALGALQFADGQLQVGEALATPVIRRLKVRALREGCGADAVILDAPPGTGCPVVETLRGCDFALLVTEPTPFGLHDLELALKVGREALGMPVGVVINRDGVGDERVSEFCMQAGVPILLRLPFDRRIASAYAAGKLWVDELCEYQEPLLELYEGIAAGSRAPG